jgi:hypothetical protein
MPDRRRANILIRRRRLPFPGFRTFSGPSAREAARTACGRFAAGNRYGDGDANARGIAAGFISRIGKAAGAGTARRDAVFPASGFP